MVALAFTFTKIMVSDLDVAERFFKVIFGLKECGSRVVVTEGENPFEERFLSVTGDMTTHQLQLVRRLDRPMPPPGEAVIGFSVSDLDASIVAVEMAGGRVVIPAIDLPEYGLKSGVVADPEGHLLELYQMLSSS